MQQTNALPMAATSITLFMLKNASLLNSNSHTASIAVSMDIVPVNVNAIQGVENVVKSTTYGIAKHNGQMRSMQG